MSADKTVPVTLPEWVWGRLTTIAAHRDVTAGDLIASAIMGVLNADTGRLQQLETELRQMRSIDPRITINLKEKAA
jgi:predicted DNA-binding ribbon-helix-helix protein